MARAKRGMLRYACLAPVWWAVGILVVTAHALEPAAQQRLGTGPRDAVEGVASHPEHGLYVAGTLTEPTHAAHTQLTGQPDNQSKYHTGFVARLDAQGKPIAAHHFAKGLLMLTTVEVNDAGVYVGGYASPGMVAVLEKLGGFSAVIGDAQRQTPHKVPSDHWTDDRFDPEADGRGVPVVLRLSHDLQTLEAGTALEGWQSLWHVPRPLREDRWQPVGLALLSDGDVVVSHDGGYVRDPGQDNPATEDHFFYVPDHLSRLSPDLKHRRWKHDIYTPTVDPDRASAILNRPWPHDTLGSTRTLRTRTDGSHTYLVGWSPTQTGGEPWWSPFLFKLDGDGRIVWRAYNPDPQSGGNQRMNGLVADSAIRSIHIAPDGHVLFAGISDGGNSVLRYDPRDYNRNAEKLRGESWGFGGRTLFWGTVGRLNPDDPELLGGETILGRDPKNNRVQAAWPIDLVGLPDGRVAVAGRQTHGFRFTPDAWSTQPHAGFLRLYDKDFRLTFSTALPGIKPMTMATWGNRIVVVGQAITQADTTGGQAGGQAGVDVVILQMPDAQ